MKVVGHQDGAGGIVRHQAGELWGQRGRNVAVTTHLLDARPPTDMEKGRNTTRKSTKRRKKMQKKDKDMGKSMITT